MKLWHKVTLGLILGIIFGVQCPDYSEIVKPVGTIFLRLIQMIILPVIFCTLTSGITSMKDPNSLGRIGCKSIVAFLGTTFFAVLFGLLVANILKPGEGVSITLDISPENQLLISKKFDFTNFIISTVPNNIIGAFAENNILQIVFFTIFTGMIINSMGSAATPIKTFIHAGSKLFLKMISKIVQLSPYAAFSLTACAVAEQGLDVMLGLYKLVFAIVVAMVMQYLIFGIFIIVFCRMSPMPFYKKSLEYQFIALSTGSSKASLATTMEVCEKKLGISESSTSFVLPIGASINMDGFAINLGLTTIFFAQMLGIDLSIGDYMVIVMTATIGSIGGAGIPGASLIMLPMVLSSVNIPVEGIAIIAGIDRILDLLRTAINITGDATVTLIIDHSENTLNKELYYSEE